MIIRHENFTNLIWSDIEKGYFIPNNKQIDDEVTKIIQQKGKNEDVLMELKIMGFQENCKIIYPDSKELSAPLEYYFDFTDACNLKCTHCYNKEQLNSNTMTEEQIEYIIKDM